MFRFVTFVGFALLACVAHADETWQHTEDKAGVSYEQRPVAGSKFREYRATFDVAATPERALEIIWSDVSAPPGTHITKRTFLRNEARELLIHDLVKTKVVSDREVTLRMWKEPRAVRFESRNDLGPPPTPGYVQLPAVRGAWTLEPRGTGTHVVYTCYSEPGGSVPAFLVRGAQQEQIGKDVEHVRERLK